MLSSINIANGSRYLLESPWLLKVTPVVLFPVKIGLTPQESFLKMALLILGPECYCGKKNGLMKFCMLNSYERHVDLMLE